MLLFLENMLPFLIPLVWLAVVALVMAACRGAARGDGRSDANAAPTASGLIDIRGGPRRQPLDRAQSAAAARRVASPAREHKSASARSVS